MSMKNKFNKVLSGFSNEEKVFLYNFLYEDLSGKGVCGDTELAHVNKHEMDVLRSMGGAGTINENTKCVQFFGSPPPPPPVQTTSVQTKEIPEELKPYVKKVLSEAEDIYDIDKETGYVPYTGKRIADFSSEQERAFDLTSDVLGQTQALATPAAQFAGLAGLGTTDADISRFMNPYASQVIDIAERERRRAADQEKQELDAQSVAAGAFGGSRQGILEAERRRNLEQGIADIRTAGLGQAFKQAVEQAQAQQESRLGAARSLTELAQVAPRGTADELARLEAVGAARRGQRQSELDIAQAEFYQKQDYPKTSLQQFSEFIQPTQRQLGAAGTTTNRGPGQAQPTYLQQASGFLGSLGSAAGAFGFGASGGQVGGLSSIVNRAEGGPPEFTEEERAIIFDQELDDNKQVATTDVVEQEGPGFVDTVGSGLSSIGDYLKERPNFSLEKSDKTLGNLLSGPTRLQRISDLLIGYSQADPSQPLGTQLGQAAASSSAKQAAERQRMLTNILAKRRLEAEEKAVGIKTAKAKDISVSTLNTLSKQISDLIIKGKTDAEKIGVIQSINSILSGKSGSNVDRVKRALKGVKVEIPKKPAAGGDAAKKGNLEKVVVPPSPEQPMLKQQIVNP